MARTILHEDVHIVGKAFVSENEPDSNPARSKGFQEALARQVEDLLDLLGESSWSYVCLQ